MKEQQDELIFRFTAWLKVVVKRAKIDYIRHVNRHANEISIEDEDFVDKLIYEPVEGVETAEGFEFDNARLSGFFMALAPKKRQVLEMLFVCGMVPEEIATELQCTVQHVYNMRSLALKELKSKLEGTK